MRSPWIKGGPKSIDGYPSRRQKREGKQRDTGEEAMCIDAAVSQGLPGPPEAQSGKDRFSPEPPKERSPADTLSLGFWPPGL